MSQKQCAYCHAILFDDDDIVFCPECGAAHHRSCYDKLGHCAREQFHGQTEVEAEPECENITDDTAEQESICPRCGKRNSDDAVFCSYCAAPLTGDGQSAPSPFPYSAPGRAPFVDPVSDPYGGVDPSGDIDGVSVSELTVHVRNNSHRYIPIFRKMSDKKKKAGWNWSGFLFSYGWMFYRRCCKEGLIVMLFTVISYILTSPFSITVSKFMYENNMSDPKILNDREAVTELMYKMFQSVSETSWILFAVGIAVGILIHLAVGILSDRIYLNHCTKRIKKIKEDPGIEDKTNVIAATGGVNIISAVIIVYLMRYVVSQIVMSFFM